MTLLAIESSSTVCGAGIFSINHPPIIKEKEGSRIHAEMLPVFVDDLLNEYDLSIKSFDGIAVSAGPGSFNGLRIGMSLAKGLAFAAEVPILPVNTAHSFISEGTSEKKYSLAIYSHSGLVYEQIVQGGKMVDDIQFHSIENIESDQVLGINFPDELQKKTEINKVMPSVKWIGNYAMKNSEELSGKSIQEISPFYYSDFQTGKIA